MWDPSIFLEPEAWIALVTLTALEIVLGIDNIVFISLLTGKLPQHQQARGRSLGLAAAMIMRVGLLLTINWIQSLTQTLFTVLDRAISARDLILIGGGLFLLAKATREIFERMELTEEESHPSARAPTSFTSVIVQIMLLDIVFSLDSVITAVGMAQHLLVMIVAVVVAVVVMLVFAGTVSRFIEKNPSMKVLALSFLLLIGVILVADGLGQHINKGYIYFAMAFALAVELLNIRSRNKRRMVA
jgi:predicted tellurium resistance membrane protein TerC